MSAIHTYLRQVGKVVLISVLLLLCSVVWSQAADPKPVVPETAPETPKDVLGRATPRGAVLGFINAARKGNAEISALYLNTPLRGADGQELARQLATVLDRKLPARLNELSDKAEGSVPDPLRPDEDLVGTITTANGKLEITVERVDRGKLGKVWLFSRKTLNSIPDVYQELSAPAVDQLLPKFLVETRLAEIPLFEWLAVFVGLPFVYFLTGLLNRVLSFSVGVSVRRLFRRVDQKNPQVLPPAIRLLLLAFIIGWLLSRVGLPLLARQFWSTAALVIAIAGSVWLLILLNGLGERYLVGRRRGLSGSASVWRLVRRTLDGLIFFAGLLFTLNHFRVDPTAALAGLGVGGIAVALAAQKTLENLIAGISLIADQAVRVGDTLKLGDIVGTVEEVGLRSTRIRTLDRTIVSLPNGQIANMSLETLSARDKYWFHPVLGLRYQTTPIQVRSIVADIRSLLSGDPRVDSDSLRVRFIKVGTFSLDVEVFVYLFASDWVEFLKHQEELLLGIMDIVHNAGAELAFPSQTLYVAGDRSDKTAELSRAYSEHSELAVLHNRHDVHR